MATVSTQKRDSMDASHDTKTKRDTTQSSFSNATPYSPTLANLPLSIQSRILTHLLDTELVNVAQQNVAYSHTLKDGTLNFKASRPPFPVHNALFYVSKDISKQARHFFYSKNLFVKLAIYSQDARHAKSMLEDSGLLFSVATPTTVERCTAHAMDMAVTEKGSKVKRAVVMFPAQYLPRLINFMQQASEASKAWAPAHELNMTILNTYDLEISRLQGDLLELFRLLNNLGSVSIQGTNLLKDYAESLQSSMIAASFDPDVWLTGLRNMVPPARTESHSDAANNAAQYAQSAIIALTYGYLTRAETLHSQPPEFSQSVQRLRWSAELALATALHSKHAETITSPSYFSAASADSSQARKQAATDLLAAESAASHALSLATDSPSPTSNPWFRSLPAELIPPNKAEWFSDEERGQSWYVLGLVHLALGECLFAAGDLERAVGMCGGRKEVEEAFARARDGIDWSVRPGVGLRRAARVARGE